MDPTQIEIDLNLRLTYRPDTGIVTLADQWQGRDGADASFALAISHNVDRNGREAIYREMRTIVGQYLDTIAARFSEHP